MKVLIVDDEEIIREGVSILLQKAHKSIRILGKVGDGEEVLAILEREKADIIISDIRMPGMDGLELLEIISAKYPDLTKVVLTGYADFEYAQNAIRLGVSEYLLKPITPEKINAFLLNVLAKDSTLLIRQWNSSMFLAMRELIADLVKGVMAESKEEVRTAVATWRMKSEAWNLSLTELKKMIGYIRLAFRVEFTTHSELSSSGDTRMMNALSIDELFDAWMEEFEDQIRSLGETRVPRNKRVIQYVLRQIKERFPEVTLSLDTLAGETGVTASYLSKMFVEVVQQRFTHYLSDYRLEQVRMRMEEDASAVIGDISTACGFEDYPYFSKLFKKKFGLSPQEYRNRMFFDI